MFFQGEILKAKERSQEYPNFVMVLFDPNPSETQFKAVVLFCLSSSEELNDDEEPGYVANDWNTNMWEQSSWEEVKSAVDKFKTLSEEDSNVTAIEQKAVATLETLGGFSDWLKENHEIEIPDNLIVEYLE